MQVLPGLQTTVCAMQTVLCGWISGYGHKPLRGQDSFTKLTSQSLCVCPAAKLLSRYAMTEVQSMVLVQQTMHLV